MFLGCDRNIRDYFSTAVITQIVSVHNGYAIFVKTTGVTLGLLTNRVFLAHQRPVGVDGTAVTDAAVTTLTTNTRAVSLVSVGVRLLAQAGHAGCGETWARGGRRRACAGVASAICRQCHHPTQGSDSVTSLLYNG